jgi:hypothetical protein
MRKNLEAITKYDVRAFNANVDLEEYESWRLKNWFELPMGRWGGEINRYYIVLPNVYETDKLRDYGFYFNNLKALRNQFPEYKYVVISKQRILGVFKELLEIERFISEKNITNTNDFLFEELFGEEKNDELRETVRNGVSKRKNGFDKSNTL